MLKIVKNTTKDVDILWFNLLQKLQGDEKTAQILAQGLQNGNNREELAIRIALQLANFPQGERK